MAKGKGWTPERRAAQAERCRRNKPSQYSTGPKTKAGKLRSSINAYKDGSRRNVMLSAKAMFAYHEAFLEAYLFLRDVEVKEHEEKQRLIRRHVKNYEQSEANRRFVHGL